MATRIQAHSSSTIALTETSSPLTAVVNSAVRNIWQKMQRHKQKHLDNASWTLKWLLSDG